jgi:predicted outer membrane lipoprotein
MMAGMCAICDGMSYDEVLADMHERVERFGFTMTGIEPDPDHPGWTYTVGLVERRDHPELAILGVPLQVAYTVLTALSRRVLDDGARIQEGEIARINGVYFHVGPIDDRLWDGDMFNQWWNYYTWRDEMGLDPPEVEPYALELVVCGSQRLPWEDEQELVG